MQREYIRRLNNLRYLPIVSIILVGINVIVFVLCTFTGNLLYNRGELSLWGVCEQKQYLRIIWSMFLHVDMDHIFNNMLILFFFGAMIEKEVGHVRYAVFYFASGIGGSLASLFYKAMTNDQVASVGASGALFGLDGLLLSMVLFSKRRMENVTPLRVVLMIVYSLYGGFTGGNVDNAAHVGGLIVGFTAGTLMCLAQKNIDKEVQI